MKEAAAVQAQNNRSGRRLWDLYTPHRQHLTAAIGEGAGRLCLLGAGNANDVDLPALAEKYREIHLVDIDRDAVTFARDRQPAAVREKIVLHAPVDLTGLLAEIGTWSRQRPALAELEEAIPEAVRRVTARLPGGFDVVASCCVFTQMGWTVTRTLGPDEPLLPDLHACLLLIHLATLLALTRPGGAAVFATDCVTSDTYPLDELAPERDLGALLDELVRDNNFILGTSPALITRLLRRHPLLSGRATSATRLAPWLWRAAQSELLYLVHALRLEIP